MRFGPILILNKGVLFIGGLKVILVSIIRLFLGIVRIIILFYRIFNYL